MVSIAAMLLFCLQGSVTPIPEIRIEFYNVSANSADVDLTIEATALPKVAPTEGSSEPRKVTRYFTWHTGATTSSDNSELANLVARAMTEGGLDATSDGAETLFKNASEVTIKASRWDCLGAQIWSAAGKDINKPKYTFVFQPDGKTSRSAIVVGGGSRTGRPKPAEGDDSGVTEAPKDPKDPKSKSPDPPKTPPKSATPPKPLDPKAKSKITELKIPVEPDADAKSVRETLKKLAEPLSWKFEGDSTTAWHFAAVSDGPPVWVFIRHSGLGKATVGLRVSAEPKITKK
jgi:hypothetical protein